MTIQVDSWTDWQDATFHPFLFLACSFTSPHPILIYPLSAHLNHKGNFNQPLFFFVLTVITFPSTHEGRRSHYKDHPSLLSIRFRSPPACAISPRFHYRSSILLSRVITPLLLRRSNFYLFGKYPPRSSSLYSPFFLRQTIPISTSTFPSFPHFNIIQ